MKSLSGISLFCLIALLAGCSGNGGSEVIATVKFQDGTPLTTGQVRIISDEFETFGYVQEDGTVDLGRIDGGVPDGVYQASIDAYAASGKSGGFGKSLVAAKYRSYETSGITIEVSGDREIEIVIDRP
ncbi:MAG: hypothetical protein ACIALR_05150 [Blastopirellula sp. JB062]